MPYESRVVSESASRHEVLWPMTHLAHHHCKEPANHVVTIQQHYQSLFNNKHAPQSLSRYHQTLLPKNPPCLTFNLPRNIFRCTMYKSHVECIYISLYIKFPLHTHSPSSSFSPQAPQKAFPPSSQKPLPPKSSQHIPYSMRI